MNLWNGGMTVQSKMKSVSKKSWLSDPLPQHTHTRTHTWAQSNIGSQNTNKQCSIVLITSILPQTQNFIFVPPFRTFAPGYSEHQCDCSQEPWSWERIQEERAFLWSLLSCLYFLQMYIQRVWIIPTSGLWWQDRAYLKVYTYAE